MNEQRKEIEAEEYLNDTAYSEIIREAKEKIKNKKMLNNNISYDDISVYVGNNFESFIKSFKDLENNKLTFNIFAFLFGPIYFMYRKMYLVALLGLLLGMIIPSSIPFSILLSMGMGLIANWVYYEKAKRDILIAKRKYNNDIVLRREMIRSLGGVNVILPIACIGLSIVGLLGIMLMAMFIVMV